MADTLADGFVRHSLNWAVVHWEPQRFVPVEPGAILPGMRLHSILDLEGLKLERTRSVAQYVLDHQEGQRLVPLRELLAAHDEDAAYDFPGTVTVPDMLHVLEVILTEQQRPEASYDKSAGRLYARYERTVDLHGRGTVECLHVFVLSASPAEA